MKTKGRRQSKNVEKAKFHQLGDPFIMSQRRLNKNQENYDKREHHDYKSKKISHNPVTPGDWITRSKKTDRIKRKETDG